MMLGISITGSALVVLAVSLLEFLFLIPLHVHARKNAVPLASHLASFFRPTTSRRKTATFLVIGLATPFVMLLAGRGLLLAGAWLVGSLGNDVLTGATASLNEIAVTSRTPLDAMLYLVACFLVIAPCEELFFRGLLMRAFPDSLVKSATVSSVAFTLYHVITTLNPYSFLLVGPYYLAWGFVLSTLHVASGKTLLAPWIAHGTYNFLLFLL